MAPAVMIVPVDADGLSLERFEFGENRREVKPPSERSTTRSWQPAARSAPSAKMPATFAPIVAMFSLAPGQGDAKATQESRADSAKVRKNCTYSDYFGYPPGSG